MSVDPKQFWETKLLPWEQGRYSNPSEPHGFLEWIANRSSMSLRFRIAIAPELLRPYLANKRIVELGCGSGIIAGKLIEYGAASYLGIDIAESAIGNARDRYGSDPRIQFETVAVANMPALSADLVISLGLFDWLTDAEISNIFRKSGKADYLHAIAELRPGIQQWLHRSYVQLAYGYRTHSYRPRYFTCDQIKLLNDSGAPFWVYRDRRLSFGALVSSLPIGEKG